ncbi:hypothetical protein [Prescottella equi]|uniref:Uncharacterized protein n=1 Tax=Rhodococcus phage REQ2 TaxID=1109713 RepID=G9FH26_9CAUD|nr:hypothetical protein [Prescottella equi]YP_005087045.1 terminase small subunit [Rhodococcus phage REQ2]AEV51855.1 hypothetical protein [Rhodococcus phage REQ2]NKR61698.1 hypothetical protein [Prescottella equi]
MATQSQLRAVTDDERVPEQLSVEDAATSGSRRALLVAMRDRIATTVTKEDCPPRDLSSLTKRLQDIANEIEAIDARDDDDAPGRRLHELESALREIDPNHPLLAGAVDDRYDASAI